MFKFTYYPLCYSIDSNRKQPIGIDMTYFNKEIETLPLPKLRKLQNERLHQTLALLYNNVSYYKHQFDQLGLSPNDIKSVEDLHKLPFTTKDVLRDQYPFGLFTCPQQQIRRIHASSGTTGKPTVVGYTHKDLELFDEVVARSLVAAGAKKGMKLHNAYGYGLFTGGLGMHGGATLLGMAVIPVSGGVTDRQLMILQDFKPEVICCTPSYAQTLAEQLKSRGIDPQELALSYAILGAEPWTEAIRSQVNQGMGVTATNIYGLSEIIGPGVSQEDFEEIGSGSYIWEDHFYPEVVSADSGEPLPYGEEGILVFTTLTKEAMPLIRYKTNDICSLHYDKGGKRTHIKMSPIKGRSDDMLIIRGVNLFPTQIESLLQVFPKLAPYYQLQVSKKGSLDHVLLKIEVSETIHHKLNLQTNEAKNSIHAAIVHDVQSKIKGTIGLNIEVIIAEKGAIPRSEGGKLNRVVDSR